MVLINPGAVEGGAAAPPFCIDSTETTNAEYAQFVNIVGDAGVLEGTPSACSALKGAVPSQSWPYAQGQDQAPVQFVNWCQAYAYCKWAGKRMCGAIKGPDSEGGALFYGSKVDPTQSQWFNACSRGGEQAYPYGPTFQPFCGGSIEAGVPGPQPVLYYPKCVGPVSGLYDMSGGVREWTDSCAAQTNNGVSDGAEGPGDQCVAMGGAYSSQNAADLACDSVRNWQRNSTVGDIGIRCCLDL
jgi:sulfatase modifying factor 1